MVGSSKILTVSYGTFSCTLEGFDDSFSTMKAIAEYFRDLAADDRYFGAEPPTPDAEMLARIAEREIARRVEARTEGTGIVLKAGQALSPPVAAEEAIAEADEPTSEAAPEPAGIAASDAGTVVAQDEQSDDRALDDTAEDALAEAIDGVDDIAPVEPAAVAVAAADEDDEDDTDPLDYEVAASKLAESLAARPTPHRVAPTRVMPPASVTPDQDNAEPAVASVPEMPPALTAPPVHPDADSVAAKLERIRAVVGKAQQTPADEPDQPDTVAASAGARSAIFDEDEPETIETDLAAPAPQEEMPARTPIAARAPSAPAPRPVRTRVIKMSLADFQRSVAQGQLEPVAAPDAPETHAAPDAGHPSDEARMDAFEAGFEDQDDDAPDFDDFDEQEFPAVDDPSGDDLEDISDDDLSDLAALDGASAEEAAADEDLDDQDLIADDTAGTDAAEDHESWLTDEEEAELLAELAELQRDEEIERGAELPAAGPARDATAERAVNALQDDEPGDDMEDDFDDAARDARPSVHTADAIEDDEDDEEEAPLNLFGGADDEEDDAFEAENAIYSGEDDEDDSLEPDPRALRRQRAFETSPDDDNEILSRLIEQTDDQLNHPETNRRRDSITQLKAAVAATEAARQMGEPERKGSGSDDEFRNDLRQAVRPRRPTRPADRPVTRTERPQAAPLKLVASQRVDIDHEADRRPTRPVAPVRPRRVLLDEASPAEAAREAGSFEAFARDMGAQGLAELLEAAAAYTAYVEGSEDFSRPQLMSKVRGLTERDFSREEGLRSFGRLLREGRIMKVRNGRFQVSEETRFHPERRAG